MVAPGQKMAHRGFVLALLCMAQFMVVLDFSIVNVALPSMQKDLAMSTQNLQWVVSAYSLTFGGFLLLGGRASDLFGRRRIFLAGLVVFSLASLFGGLAQSESWLIVARAVQGLGASVVAPTSLSLVTSIFAEGPERNKALGVMGAVASTGFAVGAILGGLLTAGPGWRWVMFVNVPVGILACVLTPFFIPTSPLPERRPKLDILGALMITVAIVILVYTLARGNDLGWLSWHTWGLLALAVVLLLAFIWIELRAQDPLVRLNIFRLPVLAGGNLVSLLLPGTFGAIIFILTLFMQQVLHYSAIQTGMAFLPMAAVLLILSNIASRMFSHLSLKLLLVASIIVVGCGQLLFLLISATASYQGALLPGMLVVGLGMGFVFPAITIAATTGVRNEEQGLASGLLNTSQQVGSSVVLAIVTSLATAQTAALQSQGVDGASALADGFHVAIWTCFACVVCGLLIALFVIREQRPANADQEEEPVMTERPFGESTTACLEAENNDVKL
ncbi:MFS transporter [Dictyobacter aurantiacus]|uniref:MFS transporter n=1 Tax=Dictyobacter aurantiacus TaxID=1936993 RepID=A0A401ZNE4_9CHLR|nr:MFS transporter [Dictyobacter aurantiacus]GCE08334.1 MFS transporter [Dictyobacter aurantiacus]